MEHPTKTLPAVSVPELSPERRLLWEAANWMEQNGWQPNAGGCAIRALYEACCWRDYETREAAQDRLQQHIGDIPIAWWSDSSGRATVVKTLRDCAVSS
jgi:hypothetical protein